MGDLFNQPAPTTIFYPKVSDLYPKTPKCQGAAVLATMIAFDMFDNPGCKIQRTSFLNYAQEKHREANGGKTNPEHETLGRELRGRGNGAKRQQTADRLFAVGWRVCAEDGRLWLERV